MSDVGYSSANSTDDDDDDEGAGPRPLFVSTTAVGEPYCRYQGSYLFNLQKLLNEAHMVGVEGVIRWHRKISNALEINWAMFAGDFEIVHPVFVQYKLSRASNRFGCVRPTMNRKLREWNFSMVSVGSNWVSYIYETAAFCKDVGYDALPTHRRSLKRGST